MAFIPKKKVDIAAKLKNILLNGYIIRYDGQDQNPLEVMEREHIDRLPNMTNIGQERGRVKETIDCSRKILFKVVEELEKDYCVNNVSCLCSGCCQYSTHGVYLDGE